MGLRYFRPARMPNDSASMPMLAATQKWPSGLFGWSAIAFWPASMPFFVKAALLGFRRCGRRASSPRAPASRPRRSLRVGRRARRAPRPARSCAREVGAVGVERIGGLCGRRGRKGRDIQ